MTPSDPVHHPAAIPAPRKPWHASLNPRLMVVLAICASVCGGIVYGALSFNGGISQGRDGTEVDLKALGCFDFDQSYGTLKDVPARYRELDGKKVVLKGFLVYQNSTTQPAQIVFNIQTCCVVGPPQVHERVFLNIPADRHIEFPANFARLVGTLHVKVEKDSDRVVKLYTMDVEKAEPG